MLLARKLLYLKFHSLTHPIPILYAWTLRAPTAATIDVTINVTIAETAGGMSDAMSVETLGMMLQVTTAEAGHISTETGTVVGLGMINDCIATTCTLALVAADSGDYRVGMSMDRIS